MKQREAKISPNGRANLIDALDRLFDFYNATARPDDAVKWRKRATPRIWTPIQSDG
jgi:hypothetical protein